MMKASFVRYLLILALLLGASLPAVATDYVITYTANNTRYYLGMNGNNLQGKTEFDSTCIWTCYNGNNPTDLQTNNGYSLRNKYKTDAYLTTSCTRSGNILNRVYTWAALSVQTTASNLWHMNSGNVYAYYSGGTWNRSASINVNTLAMIDNNTNSTPGYVVTTVQVAEKTTYTLSTPTITPNSAVIAYNNNTSFSTSAQVDAYTCKAHKSYYFTISNTLNKCFYYNGTKYTDSTASPLTVHVSGFPTSTGVTYSWALTGGASSYLSMSSTSGSPITITHTPASQGTTTSTLTVTASYTGASSTNAQATVVASTPPSAITTSESSLTYCVGDAASTFTYTLTPPYAHNDVNVVSNNTSVATVSKSGNTITVTPVAHGTTTITLTARNYAGTAACSTTVSVEVKDYVVQPTVVYNSSTGQIDISTTTPGAAIYYTSDGTTPSASSTSYTPFTQSTAATIKAIAVKSGMCDSPVGTLTLIKPATPTISQSGTIASIDCATAGATIYYTTDNSTPSASSTKYQGSFEMTSSPMTIKAVAILQGISSDVATSTLTGKIPTPIVQIDADGVVTVTPGEGTPEGTKFYYTTGSTTPSDPDGNSTEFSSLTLTLLHYIKVIGIKSGFTLSDIVTEQYVKTTVSGGNVIIDDREDHTWTYYAGVDPSVDGGNYNTNYAGKLYSPNPRNVKITYNAVNDVENSTTTVKVSKDSENETSFIYYKTLEQGSTAGEYPYQVISNPFSVRPSTGSGNSKVYYGFAGWKIISGGEYIKNKNNNDVLALDEEIVFNNLPYPSVNCISAEIVLQTTWTQANVQNGNNISTMMGNFSGGTYETNFAVLTGNYTTAWTGNKNVTVTSVYPDGSSDYRSSASTRLNVTVNTNYTVKYEYIYINNDNTTYSMRGNTGATNGPKTLYIGRGVRNSTANGVVCNIIQGYGNNNITNSRGLNYTLKIESGIYNYLSYIKGYEGSGTGNTVSGTVSVKGVLGCDYDRAKEDNTKLKIQEQIMMGYGTDANTALISPSAGAEVLNVTFKSGSLHSNMTDAGTADASESFYIGVGNSYCAGYRVFTMEGGEMWSLAAGLCNNTATTNSIRFRIKGGLIKGSIYGSAANANSYGYKQMILTGGTVKGWIAGGGNGTSNNGGTTTGSTYVYVGGKCHVDSEGSTTKINSSLGGNVFGSGSGVDGSKDWGEMLYGSNVVIADDAYIERSVFGGGNGDAENHDMDNYANGTTDGKRPANVHNTVRVIIGSAEQQGSTAAKLASGATINGEVFGGNNVNGAPQRAVTVDIYGTDPAPAADEYALFAVYGGGNAADYTYGNGYPKVIINGD